MRQKRDLVVLGGWLVSLVLSGWLTAIAAGPDRPWLWCAIVVCWSIWGRICVVMGKDLG